MLAVSGSERGGARATSAYSLFVGRLPCTERNFRYGALALALWF